MKIVHISPNSIYNEGWGYQENLLPKYQVELGYDVEIIVDTEEFGKDGIVECEPTDYINEHGVHVYRLRRKRFFSKKITNFLAIIDAYSILLKTKPDMIFFHGLVSLTIFDAVKYKKKINSNCIIVLDNHLDYNIGNPYGIKNRIEKLFFSIIYSWNNRFIDRVYGVTPWRRTYAEDIFGVPSNKTDVLVMGADDDEMDMDNRDEIRITCRKEFEVSQNEFLIVTGGKLDKKKKVIELMRAVNSSMLSIKLLIFGTVNEDIKDEFNQLLGNKIIFYGWADSKSIYKLFYASDLAIFPGQHSVLWEQACASKIPCIFAKWDGMNHVDIGGNSYFLEKVDSESIKNCIERFYLTPAYYDMKKRAETNLTDIFLYSNIAKKSVECLRVNDNKKY